MKFGQHMKLAPRMIQSMEILQMSLMQLEERIAQELESNVTLEIDENNEGLPTSEAQQAADAASDAELDGPSTVESDPNSDPDDDSDFSLGGDSEPVSEDERPLALDEAQGADDFERLDTFEEDHPDAADNELSEPERPTPDLDMLERGRANRLEG